jgi:hypothetical protein
MDGLAWTEARYTVGMAVQISGDLNAFGQQVTRSITGFADATGGLRPADAFVNWGSGSVMLLSGDNFAASATGLRTLTATQVTGQVTAPRVGGDRFDVTGGAGPNSPLVIYGDTSQDGVWYAGRTHHVLGSNFGPKPFDPFPALPGGSNEDADWIMPLANLYQRAGNDVIVASELFDELDAGALPTVGITAYGGMGTDIILGSQAGDHLAGGSGTDGILGLRGNDHIYGDSGVNVDFATRALRITTVDASPAPSLDPATDTNGTFMAPAPSQMRDRMIAGSDVLGGDASGSSPGTDATTRSSAAPATTPSMAAARRISSTPTTRRR